MEDTYKVTITEKKAIKLAKKMARDLGTDIFIYKVRDEEMDYRGVSEYFELYASDFAWASGFTRDPDIVVEQDGSVDG